jgi:hypothetical protein
MPRVEVRKRGELDEKWQVMGRGNVKSVFERPTIIAVHRYEMV